jgi:hypothetical protein
VPEIPSRGYQLIQLTPSIEINGVEVDIDIAQDDKKGGQAQWLRLEIGGKKQQILSAARKSGHAGRSYRAKR